MAAHEQGKQAYRAALREELTAKTDLGTVDDRHLGLRNYLPSCFNDLGSMAGVVPWTALSHHVS